LAKAGHQRHVLADARALDWPRSPPAADRCEVEIRGRLLSARVVRPPFVRNGTIAISL
jgi:hypothetical protein